MSDAPVQTSSVARRWLFRLAWLLLAVSLFIPPPAGITVSGPIGVSAVYVYQLAADWTAARPGSPQSLALLQAAVLALALFSNIAFVYALYLRDDRGVSLSWKVLLVAMLVVDMAVAAVVPQFAHLPAYWIWLAAIAALAVGYLLPVTSTGVATAKDSASASDIDRGEVPPLVWVLLGFTVFWIGVSAITHANPPDADARALSDSLTGYVNDRAHLLSADQVSQLTVELQKLEATTPNQIAVAIYPRAPASVDDFTIRTAERFPLGRAGLDSGAILFVFVTDRMARLEVGYGLEGALPDVVAHRILQTDLAPAFARGDYFGGLDATLKALFASTEDAYKQDHVSTGTAKWRRKLAADRPTRIERMERAVGEAGIGARIGSSLLGAFIVLALWSLVWHRSRFARAVGTDRHVAAAASDWGSFARDIGRGIGNLRAKRSFADGMERFDVSTIWDTIRLVFWTVGILLPVAGVIIIAGGGEFGGAGSLIRW